MIERLDRNGTIRLLEAMRKLAENDAKYYAGRDRRLYESAVMYLTEELPVIREVLAESFQES